MCKTPCRQAGGGPGAGSNAAACYVNLEKISEGRNVRKRIFTGLISQIEPGGHTVFDLGGTHLYYYISYLYASFFLPLIGRMRQSKP